MSSTKGYFTRSHVKELALKNQFKAQGRYSKAGPSVSRGPVERIFVLGSLGAGKSSFLASLLAHSMGNVGQRITHVTVSTGSTVPTARDLMIDLYKVGSRFGTGPKERVLPHTGGVIAPVPGIMRLFWAFSSSNPPESPSQEDSSLANMLDTLEARCRSDGPPAGPRSIDPLPGSRSFLTVSAVA